MKEFSVRVIVTETHEYEYKVEADDREAAIEKAINGETTSEDHLGYCETIYREVDDSSVEETEGSPCLE